MKKKFFFLLLWSTLIAGVGLFSAQNTLAAYPEKAVTFFCGFPAGGAMDMTARAITEAAKKYFPKPMAVVNRPGAAGTIARYKPRMALCVYHLADDPVMIPKGFRISWAIPAASSPMAAIFSACMICLSFKLISR